MARRPEISLANQSRKLAAELWNTGALPRVPQPQQPRRRLSTINQDLPTFSPCWPFSAAGFEAVRCTRCGMTKRAGKVGTKKGTASKRLIEPWTFEECFEIAQKMGLSYSFEVTCIDQSLDPDDTRVKRTHTRRLRRDGCASEWRPGVKTVQASQMSRGFDGCRMTAVWER